MKKSTIQPLRHPILDVLTPGTEVLLSTGKTAVIEHVSSFNGYYPPISVFVQGVTGRLRDTVYPNHITGLLAK